MTDQGNSVLDRDLENDSWLGEKEKSFSSKLLFAIGGISSFGGLIPSFIEAASNTLPCISHQFWFLVLSITYLVGPLGLYLVWAWSTDRVISSNSEDDQWWSIKKVPITHRYFKLLICQTVLVSIYLIGTISFLKPDQDDFLIGSSIFLTLPGVLALYTFVQRDGYKPRFGRTKAIAAYTFIVTCIFCLMGIGLIDQDHKKLTEKDEQKEYVKRDESGNEKDEKWAYAKLVQVDRISKELQELETNVTRQVELFALLSATDATSTLTAKVSRTQSSFAQHFGMDRHLTALGNMLIERPNRFDAIGQPGIWLHEPSGQTIQFSRPVYFNPKNFELSEPSSPSKILRKMRLIDAVITSMINHEMHRVKWDHFGKTEIDSIELVKMISYTNERNSRNLLNWVDRYYLPYAQKKAQEEIETIAENTSWIMRDMRFRGLMISMTNLLLLLLALLEIQNLKTFKIHEQKLNSSLDKKTRTTNIENYNKKADHLVYPLTLIISVVAILIIPLTSKMEFTGINPSGSFWMKNLPSLHLPEVAKDLVKPDRPTGEVVVVDCKSCCDQPIGAGRIGPTGPTGIAQEYPEGLVEELGEYNDRLENYNNRLSNVETGISNTKNNVQAIRDLYIKTDSTETDSIR